MTTVPTSIVDNEYVPFPEGTYRGALEDCKPVKNDDGSWMGLELSFVDIEAVGDSPEELRPFTDTITIRVKNQSLVDVVDITQLPRELFGLRLGAGLLAGLAEAFGEAVRTEEGVNVDLESMIENLQDGTFKGREATFVTRQKSRKYTNSEGNEVTVIDTRATRYIAG